MGGIIMGVLGAYFFGFMFFGLMMFFTLIVRGIYWVIRLFSSKEAKFEMDYCPDFSFDMQIGIWAIFVVWSSWFYIAKIKELGFHDIFAAIGTTLHPELPGGEIREFLIDALVYTLVMFFLGIPFIGTLDEWFKERKHPAHEMSSFYRQNPYNQMRDEYRLGPDPKRDGTPGGI